MKARLYRVALGLISERGFDETSLRDIAKKARVSPALLYRYFPSKRAVVLALYDELSLELVRRAEKIPPGRWRDRYLFALETSLAVLWPNRAALGALIPAIMGQEGANLFAPTTAFSRLRVQEVFAGAISEATDAPPREDADRLGRVLYFVHLMVILWWLLDRSPQQRATREVIQLMRNVAPVAALGLALPGARGALKRIDHLLDDALLGELSTSAGPA